MHWRRSKKQKCDSISWVDQKFATLNGTKAHELCISQFHLRAFACLVSPGGGAFGGGGGGLAQLELTDALRKKRVVHVSSTVGKSEKFQPRLLTQGAFTACHSHMRERTFFSHWHRQLVRKIQVLAIGVEAMTFWLLVQALLLSYRRLMGIKAIKLGSCDKHSADC